MGVFDNMNHDNITARIAKQNFHLIIYPIVEFEQLNTSMTLAMTFRTVSMMIEYMLSNSLRDSSQIGLIVFL